MAQILAKSRNPLVVPLAAIKIQYIIYGKKCPVIYGTFMYFFPDFGKNGLFWPYITHEGNYLTEIAPIGR